MNCLSFQRQRLFFVFILLLQQQFLTSEASLVYEYNVCNGLSNQLLYHAASIAIAIRRNHKYVVVPDHYIVNGVQTTSADVLPALNNSVPFGYVFNKPHFQKTVESLGKTKVLFIKFEDDSDVAKCAGMGAVAEADPNLMLSILSAFEPSKALKKLVVQIKSQLQTGERENGVCLHHRDGEDWHLHCKRWGSIPDGHYRGNCLGVPGETFKESLLSRGLTNQSWVYYCGDHEPPQEIKEFVPVYTRRKLRFLEFTNPKMYRSRDISALIDFFVCKSIPNFIGNSVSTFSALQIALRKSERSFWYNSQSIPLADMWRTYHIPIVYTYTELSKESGKHMLKSSIQSVRRHMPQNKIHILYDGDLDVEFITWLHFMDVQLHDHDPSWRDDIELMRQNGNSVASNLFLHPGNYFGTWQRIDIPLFIHSEYCLLMDADTIVKKPFTIADFGANTTRAIAMSAEGDKNDKRPWNAGVMLMNIPLLRKTHAQFLEYILAHVGNATFNHPAPSDQGAYLAFYKNDTSFLDLGFNFKPYWSATMEEYEKSFIIHFHGAKPHDYLSHIMGDKCDDAIASLCEGGSKMVFLCQTLQSFAKSTNTIDYCAASFPDNLEKEMLCVKVFESITHPVDGCMYFASLLGNDKVPEPPKPKKKKKRFLEPLLGVKGARILGRYLKWMRRRGPFLLIAALIAAFVFKKQKRRFVQRGRNLLEHNLIL